MRVVIDNQVLTSAPGNIADALRAARLDAEHRGRVVIEATLDGQPIPDAMLRDPPETPAAARELRFTTADPAELVAETLRGVAETLGDLKADLWAAADLLAVGKVPDAMERLSTALHAWQTVRDAVSDGANLAGLSVDTMRVPLVKGGEGSLSEQIRLLADSLQEVKRSIGAQDWSGLADVLGYDLQDQADQWQGSLEAMAQEAQRGGRSSPSRSDSSNPRSE
jgi:hypothetical protein